MLLFHYFLWAVTINYHHLAASRSASVDDDEEEEDKLHAMLSMICSRNLTAPNRMKGFYPPPSVSQSSIAARSTDAYNSVGIITGQNIPLGALRSRDYVVSAERLWMCSEPMGSGNSSIFPLVWAFVLQNKVIFFSRGFLPLLHKSWMLEHVLTGGGIITHVQYNKLGRAAAYTGSERHHYSSMACAGPSQKWECLCRQNKENRSVGSYSVSPRLVQAWLILQGIEACRGNWRWVLSCGRMVSFHFFHL